jgi:cytochrome c biogenesis protein CcdA
MDENVEVVQNRVSLWQSYKQGVGVALGILTIYVLALALLAFLASKALTQKGSQPHPEHNKKEVPKCSNSWA